MLLPGRIEIFHSPQTSTLPGKIIFSFIANANFLYGPLIYLFVRFLKYPNIRYGTLLLRALPFLLFLIADLLHIAGIFTIKGQLNQLIEIIAFELLVFQLLVYSVASIASFRKTRTLLLESYSNINTSDINWLLVILCLICGTYRLSFLFTHLMLFGIRWRR